MDIHKFMVICGFINLIAELIIEKSKFGSGFSMLFIGLKDFVQRGKVVWFMALGYFFEFDIINQNVLSRVKGKCLLFSVQLWKL